MEGGHVIRKLVVSFVCYPAVILASTVALAGQGNALPPYAPAQADDVRQLLELTGVAQSFIQVLPNMLAPLKKLQPNVPDEFWKEFSKGITAESLIDRIVPIYQKYYSQDDVKQLLSFYQSPVGRKTIQVQTDLMRDSLVAGQQWGAELGKQAVIRLAEKGYIRKTPPTKLVSGPQPAYPPLARTARVQGVVKLQAIVDADGSIAHLSVISGHPLLVNAAMDAVQHWRYEPAVLDGRAVAIVTEIDVNFSLQDNKTEAPKN